MTGHRVTRVGDTVADRASVWTPAALATLCDTIADGGSLADAARACGVGQSQARARFDKIRRDYGEQGQ